MLAPMVIAHGAGGKSQQALGTSVAGGMFAVVVLALIFVPVFFVVVQRFFSGDVKPEKLRRNWLHWRRVAPAKTAAPAGQSEG